ncbi:medium-chain fatty acid-CoA ligase faa2 [Coemansia sp. RSA 1722]|nr:medium-chain fatty acid-CoA ligase faa2 [Coemansia sp. RSA 486]KAJ2237794.1 medium-chain fatty acid-CoA ligase faa2 [Coemansia sp. RSA 485]KAJ2602452.1 medium-chain fatty acid-CoA ligase faa2 [Coemansia sp. RSA 1721]KAJ2605975.1 medium-chain fatty acid-CoA ligase faa2 [Coemansia sp. RSA 1722]KAJ2639637.1 medium-chain fatty acid-CoA ligase faa2 [Coemansia sp. RSA 1286]
MSKSYAVPSSELPGYTAIYRHPDYKDGTHNDEFSDITTLYEVFQSQVKAHPKAEFLGSRPYYPESNTFGSYRWITTTQAQETVDAFGSGLDALYEKYAPELNEATGMQPLGIFSINRPEWILTELAAFRTGRYSVGVIDASGVGRAEFDMNHSEMQVVVCSMDKITRMLERIKYTPRIKVIISMDKLDCSKPHVATQPFSKQTVEKLRLRALEAGVHLTDMDQVIADGKERPTVARPSKPADLCTLCYSSGTAGAQKGVMATHASFVYACRSAALGMQFPTTQTYFSYIPLYHVFDRYAVYAVMHTGIRIGFFHGDMQGLIEDMQQLRPTMLTTIPHVLNRMYDRIAQATIASCSLTGSLSRTAYAAKLRRIRNGQGFRHSFWDRLIFDKVSALFGGRLHTMICGSAYLDPKVQDFFRAALSCNVIQGYGQTEIMAGGTIQRRSDTSADNVGVPNPGVDMRLRSIPEMNYHVTDTPGPRGELLVRAPNVFSGYLADAEKTRQCMDGDWLATGDIATINPDGSFSIIDRVKNVIKTAQAMWIEPEPLESIYQQHSLFKNLFIHGSERERELVAIVTPDPDAFVPWAKKLAQFDTIEELCADQKVRDAVVEELKMLAARNNVPRPGYIAAVHLEPKPFEAVSGEFYTITLKVRRHIVKAHYKSTFASMYKTLSCNDDPVATLTSATSSSTL